MEQGTPLSATVGPLVDFETVCQRVRTAVESLRIHAVSLHDETGEVLWMTESSMGPDEHNAAREAFESFTSRNGRPIFAYDLGDSRSSVLFRAVDARRTIVGAIMVIVDTRGIQQDDKGLARLMTAPMQRVLAEFAAMRPSAAAPVASVAPVAPVAPVASVAPAAPAASASPTKRSPAAAGGSRAEAGTSKPASTPTPLRAAAPPPASAPRDIAPAPPAPPEAPFELTLADSMRMPAPVLPPPVDAPRSPAASPVPALPPAAATVGAASPAAELPAPRPERRQAPRPVPDVDRLHAAMRRSPIALHLQRLIPLSKGSQLRRYEVLLRSSNGDAPNAAPQAMIKAAVDHGLGSMIDRRVLTQLVGWLVRHPEAWRSQAIMLSVNLTSTALQDEHFIQFVGLCLAKSHLPKAMIAFEIDVPTAVNLRERVVAVAAAMERLGCPLVLDNFGLRTECFDLLRLPGVRYVKLAPEITTKMRTDKLSQAAVTAVVQMARVLGMHTVAKRTESAAEQEWLTALGVDFVQSNALSPAVSIDSLLGPQGPRT
jgi:EAL domain-containing protein (putative c-di-GMP-specific phosphodiesterase class I)